MPEDHEIDEIHDHPACQIFERGGVVYPAGPISFCSVDPLNSSHLFVVGANF